MCNSDSGMWSSGTVILKIASDMKLRHNIREQEKRWLNGQIAGNYGENNTGTTFRDNCVITVGCGKPWRDTQ
jgi:hypothetical protein